MESLNGEIHEVRNLQDLKSLLSAPGPCASVYVTLKTTAKANALAWREAIRGIDGKLQEPGGVWQKIRETLTHWEPPSGDERAKSKALAVFCSSKVLSVTRLMEPVRNRAVLGPRFYVRPLLPELVKARTFYILALSQNDVRMLRCTPGSSEEVSFPEGIATSFDAYMNSAKPDHSRSNMTSAGHSAGHTKGVVGSTDTEREDKPEYLAHFFHQIDRGVNQLLRGSTDPVIPVAVEYELAQYRSLNTYPHLLDEAALGAPNGLKAGEMRARALEALTRSYQRRADKALAEYDHKAGGGASNRLKEVVTAARDGRVVTLLVSDSLENAGSYDETTHSVKGGDKDAPENEDLVNGAVVETLLHAGQVFTVPNNRMPHGAPAAAIFRY
jgi:Bacterial archaeo-eukaryotic release factor family 3